MQADRWHVVQISGSAVLLQVADAIQLSLLAFHNDFRDLAMPFGVLAMVVKHGYLPEAGVAECLLSGVALGCASICATQAHEGYVQQEMLWIDKHQRTRRHAQASARRDSTSAPLPRRQLYHVNEGIANCSLMGSCRMFSELDPGQGAWGGLYVHTGKRPRPHVKQEEEE